MKLVDVKKFHVMTVRLENGIDFKQKDLVRFFDDRFEVSESKLKQIAEAIGFDECEKCGKLDSITQPFVQAKFIKYSKVV